MYDYENIKENLYYVMIITTLRHKTATNVALYTYT